MQKPLLPCLLITLATTALAQSRTTLMEPVAHNWGEALARYQLVMQRLPFGSHTEARDKLAQFPCAEGLQLLAKDYATPKAQPEFARYTIASFIGQGFQRAEFVPALDALRRAFDKPVDTWLWVQTLRANAKHGGADEVLAIARDDKNVLHRGAAILALGLAGSAELAAAVVDTCLDFPKKDADRSLLVTAMASALEMNNRLTSRPAFKEAMVAFIGLLQPDLKLQHSMKFLMARHLQRMLNGPAQFIDAEPWLTLLNQGAPPKRSGNTVVAPSFFGIEGDGMRYCYVIDMSDSMCRKIDPDLIPKGPLTGPKPKKKPKGALPDQDDIPWHKVKTRFDLAREQLKISLQRLDKDKYFCVIWFGTGVGTLDCCKGLVRATKANVDRAIAELDAIEYGKIDPVVAPEGQLRGNTNMHSALRLAFGMTERGAVDECSYVAPGPLVDGCDTMFLLSDGAPSCDAFTTKDKDYGEGHVVVDREYGASAPRTPIIDYTGPFVFAPWLLAEIDRMNAFRRVQIHCVGLGEANMELLRTIAEDSHAESYFVKSK